VVGEYCWAITKATRRSCCGPSGSSASIHCHRTTFYMCALLPIHIVDPDVCKIRHAADPFAVRRYDHELYSRN
jgi:hypothetical protein